jgi:lysophospholipase L1-like esterase
LTIVLGFAGMSAAEPEFALRDGDTVVFLGDSITAARGYSKIVELYTLMRYPDRHVRFWNAGKGGDTASGAVERLERDVFSHGATVLTVAFGVNDIGWGMKADDEHKRLYLDGIRRIVEECGKHHVRPFICSPAITAERPDTAESGYLQKMADEGLALAKSLGAGTIDLSRGMRESQRRVIEANEKEPDKAKHTKLHVEDGVHLNELGQLAMAYAMLKGLGAPAEVSQATVDAKTGELLGATGCEVGNIKTTSDGVQFTRKDAGLPLNLGILSALSYRFVPLPDGINRYMLTVSGLTPGRYSLRAEGRLLGTFTASQFAKGMNIASMTANGWEPGGPWDVQSDVVKELVDARDKLGAAAQMRQRFSHDHPQAAALDEQAARLDDELVNHARALARPYAYHFEIRAVNDPPK